ncbi:hypothetical protein P691DRAFT_788238 [Macrolepiota fuliginosa MF-IS2]|uniref:Uncharacterized protein n=1 Tax=Macrolepiota fuliginosa MF-IS2 TaxID=1400762 RepID=A0A9P5X2A6_9AGAR|nr:hypothetical protein P691DRAFT_788238 [Macrolepiota fuliginosa MF-IS2]
MYLGKKDSRNMVVSRYLCQCSSSAQSSRVCGWTFADVKQISSTSTALSAQKPQSKVGSIGKRRGKALTEVVGMIVEGERNLVDQKSNIKYMLKSVYTREIESSKIINNKKFGGGIQKSKVESLLTQCKHRRTRWKSVKRWLGVTWGISSHTDENMNARNEDEDATNQNAGSDNKVQNQ